jgi:hypothetical protein
MPVKMFILIGLGLYRSSSGRARTIPVGNFFPIVVFYTVGALIGCYAPIG